MAICQIHQEEYWQTKNITDGIIYSFFIGDMLYSSIEILTNKAGKFFLHTFTVSKFIDKIITNKLTYKPQITYKSFFSVVLPSHP